MRYKKLKILSISMTMLLLGGCSAIASQNESTIGTNTVERITIEEQSEVSESDTTKEHTDISTDTDVTAYIELPLQEHSLELTGDTTPEKLQLYLLGNEEDDTTQAEYLVENKVRQILVRVTDSANADIVLYERKFSHTHFENRQLLMLRKAGKDYLMECDMYEQQGEAG